MIEDSIDDAEFEQLQLIYKKEKQSIEDVKDKIIYDDEVSLARSKAKAKLNHQKMD